MYMGNKYEFRIMSINSVKLLCFESIDGAIERDIEDVFSRLKCIEGGNIYGLYQKTEQTTSIMNELEQKYDDITQKHIRSFTRLFSDTRMKVGEYFIKHMTSAPFVDQIRSYNRIYSLRHGLDLYKEDLDFCQTWLRLYTLFETYSYGWSEDDVHIGNSNPGMRRCRFCPNTVDNKFTKKAHAISESLGNKHLFCNEECDDCNARLAQIEDHFLRLMDIRRSLYKISGKGACCHCVEGRNFVIRPNNNNEPVIYLKEENIISQQIDVSKPFSMKLDHKWYVTNENIYKALVKYVINLLPNNQIPYFSNTIEWINGKIISDTLPPMLFGMHNRVLRHPIMDIYINSKGISSTPYCTAIFYSCDIAYMYVIPFCSIDKGNFKTRESILDHFNFMRRFNYLVKSWNWQNTYEYWNCLAWCWWDMEPGKYEIKPASDPIFDLHEIKGYKSPKEITFDNIEQLCLYVENVEYADFKLHVNRVVSANEMIDSSNNLITNEIRIIDRNSMSLTFGVVLCDSDNVIPFYEYHFKVNFKSKEPISNHFYIDSDNLVIIDHHLIDIIYVLGLTEGEKAILPYREKTCFIGCKITRLLEENSRRFIEKFDIYLPTE